MQTSPLLIVPLVTPPFPSADKIDYNAKIGETQKIVTNVVLIIFLIVISIASILIYKNSNLSEGMSLFYQFIGVLMLITALIGIFSGSSHTTAYKDAKEEYLNKREELMRKLENEKGV